MTTHPVVARRRREREELLERARSWAERLSRHTPITAAVVIGSVARGDFNRWSDLDVLVVAGDLPSGSSARLDLLAEGAPPGLQPVGWTEEELAERRRRGDPMAREADSVGVLVYGRLPRQVRVDAGRNARIFADVLSLVDAIPFGEMHESSGRVRPEPPRWADLVRTSSPEG